MIKVSCNKHSLPEKHYVLQYLLSSRLGLPYVFECDDEQIGVQFELPNGAILETRGDFGIPFMATIYALKRFQNLCALSVVLRLKMTLWYFTVASIARFPKRGFL
jgi:hypothetical protein